MRKICVITGSRADYGLLCPLMQEIKKDAALKLQLVVADAHLSSYLGYAYRSPGKNGFKIDSKVRILGSANNEIGVASAIGRGIQGFATAFRRLSPDIIVVLGDRYEILAACIAAMVLRKPIAHIHGGESTEGAIDEAIRHSITKIAHIHFPATEEYRKRIVQLGENPNRIFLCGALGLDNIKRLKLLSRPEFEQSVKFKLGRLNFLVTYHPVTLEPNMARKQFQSLLSALDDFRDAKIIFTKPNSDMEGNIIAKMIDQYVSHSRERTKAFTSLGQIRYLSAIKFADAVIGNSSSGIIEAPEFHVPTVNIGIRQKGRVAAQSVIHCSPQTGDIIHAIHKALSEPFKEKIKSVRNPYVGGTVAAKIKHKLKTIMITPTFIQKKFYDLPIDRL
jgi:UDP-hydrolysing UDP-N-acetyl-D-glucosamine 2-epimerase